MSADSPFNPFQAGADYIQANTRKSQTVTVDISWIIDASLSMQPLWDELVRRSEKIGELFNRALPAELTGKVSAFRLQLIAFRDIYMDSTAIECSPFFNIYSECSEISRFIQSIRPMGGGIAQKSALEALFCAMHGDWRRSGEDNRHILCLITDSSAYLPEDPQRRGDKIYSETLGSFTSDPCEVMPNNMDGMRRLWRDGAGTLDNWKSRLVLLAPSWELWLGVALWPRVSHLAYAPDAVTSLPLETIVSESCRPLFPHLSAL